MVARVGDIVRSPAGVRYTVVAYIGNYGNSYYPSDTVWGRWADTKEEAIKQYKIYIKRNLSVDNSNFDGLCYSGKMTASQAVVVGRCVIVRLL